MSGSEERGGVGANETAVAAFRRRWEAAGRGGLPQMVGATWIVRGAQEIVARIEDLLRPLGLTMTKYECLVVLHASRDGALKLGTMAERLGVHPTSITYAVDQLTLTGLVIRTPHPSDRRQKLATLTEPGHALIEQAMDLLAEHHFGTSGLSDEEWGTVTALLSKAVRSMEAAAAAAMDEDDDMAGEPTVVSRARRGSGVTQRRRA